MEEKEKPHDGKKSSHTDTTAQLLRLWWLDFVRFCDYNYNVDLYGRQNAEQTL